MDGMDNNDFNIGVWVIDDAPSTACIERLGDARRLADAIDTRVAVLLVGCGAGVQQELIHYGADKVFFTDQPAQVRTKVRTTIKVLEAYQPRVVLAGGDPPAREWASLLAVAQRWQLASPALRTNWQNGELTVTRLDHTGRRSCQVTLEKNQTVVVTMRAGVPEACPSDTSRDGQLRKISLCVAEEPVTQSQVFAADPEKIDIRHANRLVAGGRGLDGRQGFNLIRRFAKTLGAGVAASRMAVDLGWIEYERQVGQTGKTVEPDLYIACGISGASHHLRGMSQAKHIVAINTDGAAPIFTVAHLGLVADLNAVLKLVDHAVNAEN